MAARTVWTSEMDNALLQDVAGGVGWYAIADRLGVGRNQVIERARSLGVRVGDKVLAREASQPPMPQPVDPARAPLPAGSSTSWGALLALTPSLDGMAYPSQVARGSVAIA